MIGDILGADLEDLIRSNRLDELKHALAHLNTPDIAEILMDLPAEDEGIIFRVLPRERASVVFSRLPFEYQERLVESLSSDQTRSLLEHMGADDRAQLLDELPAEVTRRLLATLSPQQLQATRVLLGYPADTAGRFMTPSYVALRPEMSVAGALERIRRSPATVETLDVVYVMDEQGQLLDDLRLATLVKADPQQQVGELEDRVLVSVLATTHREEVVRLFERYDRIVLPVVNDENRMLGIITIDDVMDLAEAVATEDMQKIGGVAALDVPYHQTGFFAMLRKRGGWLSVLFIGEMLTASAMAHFEDEIAAAVVLALFIPLIISSGGNSGSQAATLIIRALALGELRLRDWGRVLAREMATGLSLGLWLGAFGFARVVFWQYAGWVDYGEHHLLVGATVCASLVGVICFGTFSGSMLPFLLRSLGFDPATSSAPFVATLVDVTGLVIYFSTAMLMLRGTML